MSCSSCPLYERGTGFVPAEGPDSAAILFVGEAPGFDEAAMGRPFVGAAGSMFSRLLRQAGIEREAVRVGNAIQCAPPKLWFDARAPYYRGALQSCAQYTQPMLDEGARVIVPVGATAIRRVLGLSGKHTGPEALHGTVTTLPSGQLVVPSFHPSFLQRGAANLTGTVVWDLQRALDISVNGWAPDLMELIEDPPLEWLDLWIDQLEAAIALDPFGVWCTVDIETPDTKGRDEDTLGEDDQSYSIERVNFSAHPDEGITVPYVGAYITRVERVLAMLHCAVFWYQDYDIPRLTRAGHTIPPIRHDGMWMAKMLQSDLPGALAFWAPFYSKFQLDGWLGAWKHLSGTRPVTYAAIDGPQELRCAFGMARDLQEHGQWDAYERHQRRLDQYVLKPCSEVGVPVDRVRLELFRDELTTKARRFLHSLQGEVPNEIRPLTPKEGLTRPPESGAVHTKGRATTTRGVLKKDAPDELKQDLYAQAAVVVEKLVLATIKVCRACGAQQISIKHRCEDKALTPDVQLETATVARWFWREPFNPDSPPQILAWLKHMKHPVGKSKTSDESTDKKTLEANLAKTGHPFYRLLLDYRAVKKVLSTYVIGTLVRLDEEDRLHPHFTYKPSTQRLCVAEGTPIEVLRDVSKFPLGVPIEQVRVGDWAYTFDDELRLTLRPVTWVGQTGVKPVVRVHWRSANKRPDGFVDLTPSHEVRLVSGEYRRAGKLQPGDRILSLARCLSSPTKGYEVLYPTGHPQMREHRFAFRELLGYFPGHTHHRNGNRRDNRPENLEGLSVGEHFRQHNSGEGNPRWRDGWPDDPQARRRQAWKEYRERQKETVNNHQVVQVVQQVLPVVVYDLEVADTHNFIAGELCVHNSCIAPNIQNCVADRGGKEAMASGFRKCIVARESEPEATEEFVRRWGG